MDKRLLIGDTVRFTKIVEREQTPPLLRLFGIRRFVPTDTDEHFEKTKALLKKDFIRKERNNRRFNDITQPSGTFEHYFYKLTPKLKRLLRDDEYCDSGRKLYGFEDPTFYRKGKIIGCYISHDGQWVSSVSKG
jgi:hypothetical protein